MAFTHLLCPVDFSEGSVRALRMAVALAAESRAHLTLVTVNDPLLAEAARAAGSADTVTRQTQDALKQLFDDVAAEGQTPPMAVAVAVGSPADEILKQARECDADLIVMGMQGRGGAERWLMGSTTEKVLRLSHVPVLAVPPVRP